MIFITCFSCKKSAQEDEKFEVELSLPESITVSESDLKITLKVLFSKPPKSSDIVELTDSNQEVHECSISYVSDNSIVIKLFDGFFTDNYLFSIRRGKNTKSFGSTKIVIEDSLKPEANSTVYGKVMCEGKAVKDAIISDGVEVVKTDANGAYQLASKKRYGYVFISIPSGYKTGNIGVLPLLYQKLSKESNTAERVDFQLYPDENQKEHTMLVFGDMHLANRNNDRNQFSRFTDDVNDYLSKHSGKKVYALTLGDMTWDLYWYDNRYEFEAYLVDINKIKNLTIFHTIGNHDHDMMSDGDFNTIKKYKDNIAPDYYSFNIGEVHYVILDNILCTNPGDGSRTYETKMTTEQLDWLAKDLSFVPKSKPIVVAMHATLSNIGSAERAKLSKALEGYSNVHYITGHSHKVNTNVSSTYTEHNSGAVCATWWWTGKNTSNKIHIGQDGAPGGYQIFDINGNDLKWQFKATGKETDYQFRTYDRNQIEISSNKYLASSKDEYKVAFDNLSDEWLSTSTSNEVYINVWNYDSNWKIEVSENNVMLDVSKVSSTCDPLHLISYASYAMKSNANPTFKTSDCAHMWKVKASSPNSTLEIKVTDPFGNVYTESMKRPKAFNIDQYSW